MIKTVIFDLDGTLVDSLQDLQETVNKILDNHHYPTYPLESYQKFVGDGVNKLIERTLPDHYLGDLQEYRHEFDKYYQDMCLNHTLPYPGMKQLIESLKKQGIQVAVVTNKPSNVANKIVKELFPHLFTYIFGNTDYQPRKPDPTLVNLVISLLDSSKNQTVYVGDSNVDILTAKNAKVKSIGCVWGFRGKEELEEAGADALAFQVDDIRRIIDDWNK